MLVKVAAAIKRKTDLERAQTDLFWLATEILGYDRFTEAFHKPMMADMDNRDLRRPLIRQERAKLRAATGDRERWKDLWPKGARPYLKNEGEWWPRDHLKTTCFIARCIRLQLLWPDIAIALWHAVEDKAEEAAQEMGNKWMKCANLRKLVPELAPSINAKRWLTASGFTLRRSQYRRHASLNAKGAGSEVVGGHCDLGWLDDPMGLNDILDNQVPVKRQWYGRSVVHVVRTDYGWKWCTATRWDVNDMYTPFLESEDWDCRVRAALETDGEPDYDGEPVLYDKQWIDIKRRDKDTDFPGQMMNDPSPAGEKVWDPRAEHFIKSEEAKGPGYVVVISDPAPKNIGSETSDYAFRGGKKEKDYWANAVLKLRRRGERREIVLLDGSMSREWEWDEGFREIARLQRRWGTANVAIEDQGQQFKDMHRRAMREAAREAGVRFCPIDLETTYLGKNTRFGQLASRAKEDEFLISDGANEAFVEMFLAQAREWRSLKKGRNSLQNDDCADCVSYACDPAFRTYVPVVDEEEFGPYSMFKREQEVERGTRYIHY